MTRRRIRRIHVREVIEHLGVDARTLERLRGEGLFEQETLDPDEAEELRVATVLLEELEVNPAGVHVALHLRRRLFALESRVRELGGASDEAGPGSSRDEDSGGRADY